MKLNTVDLIALILVIIGAVNWGLVGAFNFNLVETVLGVGTTLSQIVYIVVGLAGLYSIYTATKAAK